MPNNLPLQYIQQSQIELLVVDLDHHMFLLSDRREILVVLKKTEENKERINKKKLTIINTKTDATTPSCIIKKLNKWINITFT